MSDDARVPRTATHRLTIPIDLGQQNGGAIVIASASDRSAKADPALVKALARGFAWFEEMATGGADTVTAIAKRERVTDRYVSRLVELAFIDPRIIQRRARRHRAIDDFDHEVGFQNKLPLRWSDQAMVDLRKFGGARCKRALGCGSVRRSKRVADISRRDRSVSCLQGHVIEFHGIAGHINDRAGWCAAEGEILKKLRTIRLADTRIWISVTLPVERGRG